LVKRFYSALNYFFTLSIKVCKPIKTNKRPIQVSRSYDTNNNIYHYGYKLYYQTNLIIAVFIDYFYSQRFKCSINVIIKSHNHKSYPPLFKARILESKMTYISYNTGTRALPDISALALGCCAPSGVVRIYQAKHSCLCYNYYISS